VREMSVIRSQRGSERNNLMSEVFTAQCRCVVPICYEASQPFPAPSEVEDPSGVRDYYCMDLASVVTGE